MPIDANIRGVLNTLFTARQIRTLKQPGYIAEQDKRVGVNRKDVGEQWAVQWYAQYRVVLFQRAEQLRHKLSMAYSSQLDTVMMRRIEDSGAGSGGTDPLYDTSPNNNADPASTSGRTAFTAIDSNKAQPTGITQKQWWEPETAFTNPINIPGLSPSLSSLLSGVLGPFGALFSGGDMPLFQDVAYGGFDGVGNLAGTAILNGIISAAAMGGGAAGGVAWDPADIWLPLFYDPAGPDLIARASANTGAAVAAQTIAYGIGMGLYGPVFNMPGEVIGGSLASLMQLFGYGATNSAIAALAAAAGNIGTASGGLSVPSGTSGLSALKLFNNHDIDYFNHQNHSAFLNPFSIAITVAPVEYPEPPVPPISVGENVLTQWENFYNGWMSVEEKSQNINAYYAQQILHADYTRDTNKDTILERSMGSGSEASHFRNLNIDGRQLTPKDSIWDDSLQDDGGTVGQLENRDPPGARVENLYDPTWGNQTLGDTLANPNFQIQQKVERNHGGNAPIPPLLTASRGVDELQPPTARNADGSTPGFSLTSKNSLLAIDGHTNFYQNSAADMDNNRGPVISGSGPSPFGDYAQVSSGSNLFAMPTTGSMSIPVLMQQTLFGTNGFATLSGGTSAPSQVNTTSTKTVQMGAAGATSGNLATGWESWKDVNPMPTMSMIGMLPGLVTESFAHSLFMSDLFHYTGGWTNLISDNGCDFIQITDIGLGLGTCPFENSHWDTSNWAYAPVNEKAMELYAATGVDLHQGGGDATLRTDDDYSGSVLGWMGSSLGDRALTMGKYAADLGIAAGVTGIGAGVATAMSSAIGALNFLPSAGSDYTSLAASMGVAGAIGVINSALGPTLGSLVGAGAGILPANKNMKMQTGNSGGFTGDYAQPRTDGATNTGDNGARVTMQGDFSATWHTGSTGIFSNYGPSFGPIPFIGDNPSADAEYDAHVREFVAPFLGIMRSPSFLPGLVYNLVNKRYYNYAHSYTNGPAMRAANYREGYQHTFDLGFENGVVGNANGLFGNFLQFLVPIAMLNASAALISGQSGSEAVQNITNFLADGLITMASIKGALTANAGGKNIKGVDVLAQSQGKFDMPTGGYWSTMNFLSDWDMDQVAQEYWTWTEQQQDGGDKEMAWRLYNDVIRPHMLRAVDFYNKKLFPVYSVNNRYEAEIENLFYFPSFFIDNPGWSMWDSMLSKTTWRANKYMTQYWMDSAFHDLNSSVPQYEYGTMSRPPEGGSAWQAGTGSPNLLAGTIFGIQRSKPDIEGLARNPGYRNEGAERLSKSIGLSVSSSRYTQFSARQTWSVDHQTAGAAAPNEAITYGASVKDIAHVQNKWLADGSTNIEGNQSLAFEAGEGVGQGDLDLTFNRDLLYKIRFTPERTGQTIQVNRATNPMFGGGMRLAEVRDTQAAWANGIGNSEMKHSRNNRVVNLVKQYIGDPDAPTTWLNETDPALAREYRDVFHMGFFNHVNITGQANDVGGGGVHSSLDVNYINRVLANKLVLDSINFDMNDYYAAGGGVF